MTATTPVRAIALACLLLAAPAAAAPGLVPVPGGQVAMETCGSGARTVVLLHDSALDASAFDEAWPLICARVRAVRYDRRGYGASPPTTGAYDAVADLDAVIGAGGGGRAVLVGSSSGGGIAVDYALAHPDKVDGLVLVGPTVGGFRPTQHFQGRMARLAGLLTQGRLAEAVRDPYILTAGAHAARARVAATLAAHPGNLAAAQLTPPASPPAMGRLSELKTPTLIVTGEVDIADVHAHAGALEASIPGARRTVMGGAGHFLYLEQPKAFADLVIAFAEGIR